VFPPSREISTAPTTPPPKSTAVPEIVIGEPAVTVLPDEGEVIDDLGGAVSVEATAGTKPPCSVAG
jgi:hypothetical protein